MGITAGSLTECLPHVPEKCIKSVENVDLNDSNPVHCQGEQAKIFNYAVQFVPFSTLTLLVWRQEGHPACKKLCVGLLVVTI